MLVNVADRAFELSETLSSEELAPIFADAWTASRVWTASQFLSEHLVQLAAADGFDATASVIELGSGCGLVGLVAATLGAQVLLTDQREALELLTRNAAQNLVTDNERRRVSVHEYRWGVAPQDVLPKSSFDYVLVSDCINPIYGSTSWRQLARSLALLSDESTVTLLSHEARGDDEAMADFLSSRPDANRFRVGFR
ncbi:hypothetical protein P43SY_009138 [Pythium insidiosum]|uniref:Uncharacterized protein n=1 Tax=Pythium insidiosum TaxID=114742 RepID=A0AAD5M5Q2_PYTIN|nr:hypothetical protein P43SY_009138 [Pythium insidiosum]